MSTRAAIPNHPARPPVGRVRLPSALAAATCLSLAACGGEEAAPAPAERESASSMTPAAEPAPPPPAWRVERPIYTASQAERGQEIFRDICSACHALDFFTSSDFHGAWTGGTVADLFDFASGAMPRDNPGGLELGDYAAVLSFVFRENGLPPGDEPLPVDLPALRQIRLEPAG